MAGHGCMKIGRKRLPVMVWVKQIERLQAGAKRYTRSSIAPSELQPPKPAYLTDGQLTPPIGKSQMACELQDPLPNPTWRLLTSADC